jgi:hypothetical protein
MWFVPQPHGSVVHVSADLVGGYAAELRTLLGGADHSGGNSVQRPCFWSQSEEVV